MSMSIRSALVPAVAMATVGAAALSPVLVAAPGQSVLPAIPSVDVRTADVELAGIGQDIYYSITPTVQYVVGGGSYLVNFTPLIGGVIAAQININYFQGIQPVVEATVNYLAGVVQDPFAIVATLTTYATTLYDIGYNWVSAELQWAGLDPLPPLRPAAASNTALARAAATRRVSDEPAAVAPEVVPQTAPDTDAATAVNPVAAPQPSEIAEVDTPAVTRPRERARATRSAAAREQLSAAAAAETTAAADKLDGTKKRATVRSVRAQA